MIKIIKLFIFIILNIFFNKNICFGYIGNNIYDIKNKKNILNSIRYEMGVIGLHEDFKQYEDSMYNYIDIISPISKNLESGFRIENTLNKEKNKNIRYTIGTSLKLSTLPSAKEGWSLFGGIGPSKNNYYKYINYYWGISKLIHKNFKIFIQFQSLFNNKLRSLIIDKTNFDPAGFQIGVACNI